MERKDLKMNKYRIVSDGNGFYWVQTAYYGTGTADRWENHAHNIIGKSVEECENKLSAYIDTTKDYGKIVVEKELYL